MTVHSELIEVPRLSSGSCGVTLWDDMFKDIVELVRTCPHLSAIPPIVQRASVNAGVWKEVHDNVVQMPRGTQGHHTLSTPWTILPAL